MNVNAFSPLSELPHEQRVGHLVECIQEKIAEELKRPADKIPLEASFESLNEAWADLLLVYDLLQDTIEKQLGRKFYDWEMSRPAQGLEALNTIQILADTLVEDMDIPAPETSFTDPFEGGNFAWELPAPIIGNSPRNPSMVFLLSSPRAGSTLLRVMLEGHSDLFSPPELYLLIFESIGDLKKQTAALGYDWIRYGLMASLMKLENLSGEAAYQRLEELEAKDVSTQQVYQMLQNRINGRLLVDKTPLYSIHRRWLDRAETIFDGAKYLCLVRHPYAVIESFVRMRLYNGALGNQFGVWDDNPWLYAEKWWAAAYRNLLDFCDDVDTERYHLVHFEDLVRKPREVQNNICDFLGIPFDENVLNPYEGERMVKFPSDPNFINRAQIDPGLATAWQNKCPPQKLSNFTREVAAEFGYELD